MKRCLLSAMLLMCAMTAFAADGKPAEPKKEEKSPVSFGGDLRLRYDADDRMPKSSHNQSNNSESYFRVRARIWGKAEVGPLSLYARIADEFRYYNRPSKNQGKQALPDVLFIDNLYLDFKQDWFSMRLGRQDFAFGAKRVIGDATGGDGSRSTYADGAKFTFEVAEKRKLNLFGAYQAKEDWMPTLGKTHSNRHAKGTDYSTNGYKQDEAYAGAYYEDRGSDAFGFDLYAIYKAARNDSAYKAKRDGKIVPYDADTFSTETVGFRLLPKFTESLSGEFEAALQAGDRSHMAFMGYAGLTLKTDFVFKPKFTLGVTYLSGDKEGAYGKNAWQSVMAHDTGIGENPAKMYDNNSYTNLLYPHLAVSMELAKNHKLSMQTGPMFAPVKEDGVTGAEECGNYRGYFASAKYACSFGKYFDNEWLTGMGFAISGELLAKGDYFKDNNDSVAWFGRLELTYKF